jgi:hypothetical protein
MTVATAEMRAVLVYQAGIANVFEVDSFNMADYGRDAKRLLQSDFRTCEAFARGMAAAGALVTSAACNMAGDVACQRWTDDLEAAPFSDQFRPVQHMIGRA